MDSQPVQTTGFGKQKGVRSNQNRAENFDNLNIKQFN